MYYPHFGLKEPPFKITPNTDFFFSGGNRGAVLDALVYAITNGEGIIKVVGEVGSGKTMLCRMLQTILPEKIESIYLANPSVAPEDVLHAIAFELQLKLPKNADRLKVMQVLQAHLLNRHAEGRQVVIFVEEAQGMPLATLEEIRLLSNLETKQDKLLQIVLFGQPELDANLSETHIRQLRERITHSFHLEPLGTKDIGEYLILRLRTAGYHGPHLFSDAAIKKLSSAAEGLARRVNILADKSLLAAFADNVHQVTPKHVKAAIQDSEFGRKTTNYKQYFIGTILLIALLAAFIGYGWWQYQHQPKITAKASASQSENIAAKTNELIINDAKTVAVASPIAKVDGIQTPAKAIANPVEKTIDAKQSLAKLSLIDKRLEVTQNLLASAQPSTITLQIKSLPTDAKLSGEQKKDEQLKAELERLSQQLEIDNIYLYRKMQSGVMYTVILYGDFTQRSDALAALKNLPEPIKNSRPYLRTFAGISRDIEQTQ
ncbi:ExeA family protein [Methylotenera sp.]|uniref:ExeA family protein n=1 Tax=Methylotenera sp. TaxID=2051956 RepID=UPI00272F74A7|nr:AAA family ATPase [Methylotenera sp.]MDP2070286.1 AAA family ATPase [Methylotenera sp.]MDP3005271.1 AAA family ATPase [Methylotenera sp.]